MEAQFWHERWTRGETAFHEGQVNAFLARYVARLHLPQSARVLLPLCGKSYDIHWLLAQGLQVVGVELSPLAVDALFANLGVTPVVTPYAHGLHYATDQLEVWVGDIFALQPEQIGKVDAVYDRAAMVALPESMRVAYANQIMQLSQCAKQLLISFDYDQAMLAGPPFAVPDVMLKDYYGQHYQLTLLARESVQGGLKGKVEAFECAWLLEPKGMT